MSQAEAKAFLGDAAKGIDLRYTVQEEEARPETVGYALKQQLNEKRHWLKENTIFGY